MNASTVGVLLAVLTVTCHANFIPLDVEVSEVSNGKVVKSEESEIFIDEFFLTPEPPTIELNYEGEDEEEEDGFIGRDVFNMSDIEYQMSFGKDERHHPDEHMNFAVGFVGSLGSPHWSPWTCCRRIVNIQSRQRIVQAPRIEMEYKRCSRNFCSASMCTDNMGLCEHFMSSMGNDPCNPSHMMATFMSHHCPQTCGFCGSGPAGPPVPTRSSRPWETYTPRATRRPFMTTTTEPWWRTRRPTTTRPPRRPTTTVPWWRTTNAPEVSDSKLVKVTILYHNESPPYPSYKFSIDKHVRVTGPWRKIRSNSGELSSFYLYRQPTDTFRIPIRFCSSSSNSMIEKWTVRNRRCSRGWDQRFVLYASTSNSKSSTLYYVGNRGRPQWSARVSTRFPSKGYTSSLFYFYGPKVDGNNISPTPRPRPTFPSWPSTTRRPFPTTTRRPFPTTTRRPFLTTTRRPIFTTTRRPPTGPQPTNSFNRECLDAHNFFRAVHNVPPLRWSPELARTAQGWAQQLKEIAPERPDQLVDPGRRTRNWPHSDSGGRYRNRGDGENIAWDLSGDGSPAKESVLRWYSEIFYYNRQHPTHAPAPDKPVGHLTQLLWKDTTELGCGHAITEVGRYNQKSTWTVSHYSPGGNIRYGNSAQMTLELYNEQVPDMRRGSCMTNSGSCSNGNQCLAFGPNRGTCACTGSGPKCESNNGCIAWCENRNRRWPWKEECQGRSTCECTNEGAVCN